MFAFLMVDVTNAFDCVDRNAVLSAAALHLPVYFLYIGQCYREPPFLLCSDQFVSRKVRCNKANP